MIGMRSNGDRLARRLSDVGRKQLPFATAVALTRTAKGAAEATKLRLRAVLDNPKSFTVNAPKFTPAKKAKPVAWVSLKKVAGGPSPVAKYLRAQERGGPRRHKGFEVKLIADGIMRPDEFAVPGRALKLDRYGNISRANLRKIFAGLAGGGGKLGFFVGSMGGNRGVYRRRGKRVEPVLMFVRGAPRYAGRLGFRRAAVVHARRVFGEEMSKAFAEAMETAKKRG